MNDRTDEERLGSAIESLPDPNGLGRRRLPGFPKVRLVECRCKECSSLIAAVVKTPEGPLFMGTIVNEFSLLARNKLLKAHHDSPETESGPNSIAASWKMAFALQTDDGWHGDLSAHCPKKHGVRRVDVDSLTTATLASTQSGKTKTILF